MDTLSLTNNSRSPADEIACLRRLHTQPAARAPPEPRSSGSMLFLLTTRHYCFSLTLYYSPKPGTGSSECSCSSSRFLSPGPPWNTPRNQAQSPLPFPLSRSLSCSLAAATTTGSGEWPAQLLPTSSCPGTPAPLVGKSEKVGVVTKERSQHTGQTP